MFGTPWLTTYIGGFETSQDLTARRPKALDAPVQVANGLMPTPPGVGATPMSIATSPTSSSTDGPGGPGGSRDFGRMRSRAVAAHTTQVPIPADLCVQNLSMLRLSSHSSISPNGIGLKSKASIPTWNWLPLGPCSRLWI